MFLLRVRGGAFLRGDVVQKNEYNAHFNFSFFYQREKTGTRQRGLCRKWVTGFGNQIGNLAS